MTRVDKIGITALLLAVGFGLWEGHTILAMVWLVLAVFLIGDGVAITRFSKRARASAGRIPLGGEFFGRGVFCVIAVVRFPKGVDDDFYLLVLQQEGSNFSVFVRTFFIPTDFAGNAPVTFDEDGRPFFSNP